MISAPTGAELLVTVPGSHNRLMGCPADWATDCVVAALHRDPDGRYRGRFDLPAGQYQYKVAVGGTWDRNYGADGVPGGANLDYDWGGGTITFDYDPQTHRSRCTAGGGARAHWVDRATILIPRGSPQLPEWEREMVWWSLHSVSPGDLAGTFRPLESRLTGLRPGQLTDRTRQRFPALADHLALTLDEPGIAAEALTGPLSLVGSTASDDIRYVSGVQVQGVLDELPAAAGHRRLEVDRQHGTP